VPAYELLFRDPAMNLGLGGKNPTAATATVLIDGFELIRPTLSPGQRLFINFTEETLEAELATILPPDTCVVEVLEDVRPLPTVLRKLQDLKQKGYTLALDDYVGQETLAAFLPLVDIVKVDVLCSGKDGIRRLANALDKHKVILLAEKVEDLETMRLCRDLHFSLFQGFFFGNAEIVKGKKLSPAMATKFRLLSLSANEESKLTNIAEAVMADIALAYKLLRYINAVHFGLNTKVKSIKQAIILLGRWKFHQWLCITTLVELNTAPLARELAYTSALRGKFLEVIARRHDELQARRNKTLMSPQQSMGTPLFLLGLFSLLENILGVPLEQVQNALPMEEEMLEALVKGTGPYAPWLELIKAYECGAWDKVDILSAHLGQSAAILKASYTEASLWAADIFASEQQSQGKRVDSLLNTISSNATS
jgi:EAL and modified HD-GYP domain-containing signal transduction protein